MVHTLEKYAFENNIPIMQKDGIEFLLNFIKEHNVKSVLEIGTAIGYSAIRIALINEDIKITTIERDEQRFALAMKNIHDFDLEKQIDLVLGDALDIELDKKYDLIFIDAAKSQYIKFFEKFEVNLNDNGYIVSDNLSFHGLVETNEEIKSRNVRGIVRKIKNYIHFLKDNKNFETTFYSVGDGVSISTKK